MDVECFKVSPSPGYLTNRRERHTKLLTSSTEALKAQQTLFRHNNLALESISSSPTCSFTHSVPFPSFTPSCRKQPRNVFATDQLQRRSQHLIIRRDGYFACNSTPLTQYFPLRRDLVFDLHRQDRFLQQDLLMQVRRPSPRGRSSCGSIAAPHSDMLLKLRLVVLSPWHRPQLCSIDFPSPPLALL